MSATDAPDAPDAAAATVTLTVGTAGHIDHGKTELIKYLTGCDCDRLPEEKARGMTIDLGFATCLLPDGRQVGIVDVPGHERFIHNMVAGAAGIDAVLLVVAADDGVMPQTIEHFHIVRLLGISSGMVVVTKTDLVSPERVTEVTEQVRILTDGSFLEACPIVPMSAKTGDGYSDFYDTFVAMVARTAERDAGGPFRMHIERAFVLKGLGTIVSGIPRSGKVGVGDSVVLLPRGETKRVRALQVYGKDASVGRSGECVALRLSDLSHGDVKRGMVLAAPGYYEPTRFVNAKFQMLPSVKKALRPRTAVRFHVGTDDVPGHMLLQELKPLKAGEESYVQFQFERPVVAAPGDFFVVRILSPVITIGGGYVLSGDSRRMRRKGSWVDDVKAQEQVFRSPDAAVRHALEQTGDKPVTIRELAQAALVNEDTATAQVAQLCATGESVELPGGRYVGAATVESARSAILKVLGDMHEAQPLSIGFPRKDVLPRLNAHRLVIDRALETLVADERLANTNSGYQRPDCAPSLSPRQAALSDTIEQTYREKGFTSPRVDELPAIAGAPEPILRPIVDYLLQSGVLVQIETKVIMHRDTIDRSREELLRWFEEHETIEIGQFRNLVGTTRKFAVPLLEYWDANGLTRRTGNHRVLKGAP
jgi:selenocysteine-specific elongation factor